MRGSLDHPPIVVRASRARALFLTIGSAAFVALGLLLLGAPDAGVAAWLCIGFFGLCGLVGAALLLRPGTIEIGPAGFTQTVLWRTARYGWADVYDFRPALIGLANKAVGFDFLTEKPKRTGLRRLNAMVAGVQGTLSPGWELTPERLADLLNEAREHWLDAAEPSRGPNAPAPRPPLAVLAGSRIGRKTYWLAAGVILAIDLPISYLAPTQHATAGIATLLFIRLFAARLHDFGRSGWWQLTLFGPQIFIVVAAVLATHGAVDLAAATALGVQLVFTAVVGLIPGDPHSNRFGPPPHRRSAIAQAEVFR